MASSSIPAISTRTITRPNSTQPFSESDNKASARCWKVPSVVPAQAKMPASAMINITTPEVTAASVIRPQRFRRLRLRYNTQPTSTPYATATTAASVGVNRPERRPPRMITGANSAGKAALRLGQKGGRSTASGSSQRYFFAKYNAGASKDAPARMPGKIPAANSARRSTPGTTME